MSRLRKALAVLTVAGVLVGGGAAGANAASSKASPSPSSSSSSTTHARSGSQDNCPNM